MKREKELEMNLEYKENWEKTKENFKAWWAREYFGRCALAVRAPLANPPTRRKPADASTIHEQWYDLDAITERLDYTMSQTFHGGEAFPIWYPGHPGIASIPTMLGCPFELDMRTGWHEPLLTDPDGFDIRSLRLDENNPAYQYQIEVLRRAVKESEGKCIPSLGAFYHGGDTLAALRDTEQLLIDCIERPEVVRDAEDWLMEMWCDFYGRFYDIIQDAAQGSTCWINIWAPGKTYAVSNDFSYNISSEMFRELFLPAIEFQTIFLDYSIYHVDGVESFRHIDALCELPKLQALQILPGAGQPSALHFMDILKKVQESGKNLQIYLKPHEVEQALEQLSARGLLIMTRCETESDARDLLNIAEKESVDRG